MGTIEHVTFQEKNCARNLKLNDKKSYFILVITLEHLVVNFELQRALGLVCGVIRDILPVCQRPIHTKLNKLSFRKLYTNILGSVNQFLTA